MIGTKLFSFLILALTISEPLAVSAQTDPIAERAALASLTNAYFAAAAHADANALIAVTANSFQLITPGGTRLTGSVFYGQLAAHYLVASVPMGSIKISDVTVSGNTATEQVNTSTYDRAFLGRGVTVERDFASHQLTWYKAADSRWLLAEDHVISAKHYTN